MQNEAAQDDHKYWRGFFAAELTKGQTQLAADFYKTANTAQALKDNCQLVDKLLKQIWQHAKIGKDVSLIAVGGYGRCELFPHSDIDLLILLPATASIELNTKIESLVGLLWDIGLNVGHSVRNLTECIDEANKDVTVQTNLLEARLLAGSNKLFLQLSTSLDKTMLTQIFFEAKLKEQRQRYAKYNDTAYNLEPNIKESPGGLRDLHTIIWIMKSQKMGNSWASLVKNGIISRFEARQIRRHQQFLQMLRVRLHLLAKRREDRLLFDYQNELAAQLGLVNTPKKRASEQLMQNYYRSVKFISLMNEILLQTLLQKTQALNHTEPPVITQINERFESNNQLLEAKNARLFQLQPSAILESFLLLQQHPELTGMSVALLRNLLRVKKLVNRDFRQNIANKKLFIEILSQPNGVNHSLRRMNRYGILGEYMPAFGKIIGQMQHDLFHVYTVDEHILNVLANLRRFSKPELAYEFPLCSKLFAEFDAPHLLYLAALFHDIAKGRGGDHSSLGTLDAKQFCKSHGLSKVDVDLVAWLVKTHLTMSSTAQKSDLSDPDVIAGFAKLVGNQRHLKALYLLTVADIRGTSPAVWNAWKARLLESLFYATERLLNADTKGESNRIEKEIQARQAEATLKLSNYGLKQEAYQHLWISFGNTYFIRFEAGEIAWHSRLLTPHLNTPIPIVRARLSPSGDGIEVMIYTHDQNDLFARICNFFDRMGYSIAQAKIYTTDHNYALNTFIVLDHSSKSVSYSGLLKYIEVELTQKLDRLSPLDAPLQGRISRQVKHMPISAQITITEDVKSNNHLLEVITNDRPGLLASIARMFLQQDILLHNAKINTLGNRAEDNFVISAKKDGKLSPERINKLKEALCL